MKILINALPIIIMIALIPIVKNDYLLLAIYICVIGFSFAIKLEKKDMFFFVFGLIIMIISEAFFVSTGVETFIRNSLFGLMPLWLPFLWGYTFVAIRRAIIILNNEDLQTE